MTGTVVVGYIPTPQGIAAFERAKEEALLRECRLVVVNTGQNGDFATPSFATAEDIDAIGRELRDAGLAHEVLQATSGLGAAEEILRVAAAESAELIVIGIRHRTPVGKLFLGSTSQQVLLDAPCAVLAVKARTTA
ncbi:nucleotide-binding universal stress UspA family protein [Phycicoccus badiiscoriae]|uniref:Nucleotide-binding universal stress UspA family protein n=1 Tax=Pedococcus badiiscoriae TaxID=642776 RepID=A0A852WBW9_9MICO|nr:nucleotide-binding universal stress UspA family protein [Pedococcus badiiscoriae]